MEYARLPRAAGALAPPLAGVADEPSTICLVSNVLVFRHGSASRGRYLADHRWRSRCKPQRLDACSNILASYAYCMHTYHQESADQGHAAAVRRAVRHRGSTAAINAALHT